MTTGATVSWNKIITICSAFGIPLISLICWLVFEGAQIMLIIQRQGDDIRDIRSDLKGVHIQMDTISQRQRDQQLEAHYRQVYLQQQDNKK